MEQGGVRAPPPGEPPRSGPGPAPLVQVNFVLSSRYDLASASKALAYSTEPALGPLGAQRGLLLVTREGPASGASARDWSS